jgi:hypothetical protein
MKLSNTLVPFTALSLSSTSAFADAASDGAGFIGSLTLLALIIFFVIRSISSLLPQKGCPILRLIKAKAKARSENGSDNIVTRVVKIWWKWKKLRF